MIQNKNQKKKIRNRLKNEHMHSKKNNSHEAVTQNIYICIYTQWYYLYLLHLQEPDEIIY